MTNAAQVDAHVLQMRSELHVPDVGRRIRTMTTDEEVDQLHETLAEYQRHYLAVLWLVNATRIEFDQMFKAIDAIKRPNNGG